MTLMQFQTLLHETLPHMGRGGGGSEGEWILAAIHYSYDYHINSNVEIFAGKVSRS